jgi:hypothetical protein
VHTVEYVFRPTPGWFWPAVAACLALDVAVGYLLGWHLAVLAALGAVGVMALRPRPVRLERDEAGAAHVVTGIRDGISVDLSRLVAVSLEDDAYGLRDDDGTQIVLLDQRLCSEVLDAAARRRLELGPETHAALLAGRPRKQPLNAVIAFLAISTLLPFLTAGFAVLGGDGIELDRDNEVSLSELQAANTIKGALANPFAGRLPRDLYLVPLDETSRRRLPELGETLRERFGMQAASAPPVLLDGGVLNRSRKQLDGWRITDRLLRTYQRTHPGSPVIVIAVTRLDTFNPNRPGDRFAFLTSGATDRNVVCGGVVSTARFDFWPGSEDERLAKMAGRLLARCLDIHENISIRSISDVDRLDERAGADPETIARRVADRRALTGTPLSP